MSKTQEINKGPFISLAALYASVIIGWIAYYNYQPQLLQKYKFEHMTMFLYVSQGIILVVTPIIAGIIGDKLRRTKGQRLPVITAGISFAAMIFMSVAFTLIVDPGEIFKWILPILIVLWLFSMALFTSPAISTVELFAPTDRLPRAMAILTVIYGILYALEPVVIDIIEAIGAPLTFVVGGVAVLASGYAMRKNTSDLKDQSVEEVSENESAKNNYIQPLALGISFGVISTILFNIFPDKLEVLANDLLGPEKHGGFIVSIILAVSALVSLPLSQLVDRTGVSKASWIGIAVSLSAIIAMITFSNDALMVVLVLVFIFGFTMTSISTLPLSLSGISNQHKVLGVGIFFSGFEIPNSILEAYLTYQGL